MLCIRGLRSSVVLRGLGWWMATDVSGQPIRPVFKGQAVQEGQADQCFDYLIIEAGIDRLCQNVGNQLPTYTA